MVSFDSAILVIIAIMFSVECVLCRMCYLQKVFSIAWHGVLWQRYPRHHCHHHHLSQLHPGAGQDPRCVLYGMCSQCNVLLMECVPCRTCSLWNVFPVERVLYEMCSCRMCSLWNVFPVECVLNRMCSIGEMLLMECVPVERVLYEMCSL